MRMIDADALKANFPVPKDMMNPDEVLHHITGIWAEIDNAPTIMPEPQWISVKERLPDESGQYLITVKYKHVDGYDDIYAEHGEWADGKWDMFCFGHCGEVEDIIAWMPLPEPMKGES